MALVGVLGAAPVLAQQSDGGQATAEAPDPLTTVATTDEIQEVVVTAARRGLIGTATTASEGIVVNDELALTPAYRPGQLLETVPGLVVTSHSGEGKANQYLMRGFNLDHGTNLGTYVDGMPINEPTNAHGQGYTDLNFMIPELVTNIRYTKGTYYAGEGDFSSVGSVHMSYLNAIVPSATATLGTLGFQRIFSADSVAIGDGQLLGALEAQHYDGPWDHPDDQRKINAVLRYSDGDARDGYSVTAMFYHGLWNASTDQPVRALSAGLIDRFGSLDPSDGGQAQRGSVSAQYFKRVAEGQLAASAYYISNRFTLWNDFTHFLVDPINGDQEAQHEDRSTVGGAVSYSRTEPLFGIDTDWIAGAQSRFDYVEVSRLPTRDRQPLSAADDPLSFSESDKVHVGDSGVYVQATAHWNAWFRSVLGLREEFYSGSDSGTNMGAAHASLFQPKGSLIFTPVDTTEFYLSAGKGFHSDDLRGVTQAQTSGTVVAPLLASQIGEEIGIRQQFTRRLTVTLALFNLDAQSETTYNADIGQDNAGPASRRRGFEINMTYQALSWLEFYGSYSANHARFKAPFDDGTGHVGEYLANAPFATGSFAAYVKNLGPWSGGLEYRYLGAYPLSSDDVIQGSGYGEWNGDFRYSFASGWTGGLGLYNILDVHANAAEFWYIDRLPGEPAAGVADRHVHPLEPRTVRFTVSKRF
ncbi:MAG: TonB-dependent receptor plug domain-containing protein [Steroidobacteraceae bacterium]